MNQSMPTALADSSAMQVGDSQPRVRRLLQPDLEAGQRRRQQHQRETVQRGKFAEIRRPAAATAAASPTAAITPGMTLIRNSHGHDQLSVIQPPTTGPTVGASTATTPPIVVATA